MKIDCVRLLQKFLPKIQVPEPKSILRSDWYSNPNTKGSYSYQTVESELANLGPETLEEPLAKGKILFAGEATSLHHYSTVHGAIESGWREADRIICSLTEK